MSAVPFHACRAHLFKEAGGPRNNNRIDQNEGVLRHPANCLSLFNFEGNKFTEKKDKCTGECTGEGTCWNDMIISSLD